MKNKNNAGIVKVSQQGIFAVPADTLNIVFHFLPLIDNQTIIITNINFHVCNDIALNSLNSIYIAFGFNNETPLVWNRDNNVLCEIGGVAGGMTVGGSSNSAWYVCRNLGTGDFSFIWKGNIVRQQLVWNAVDPLRNLHLHIRGTAPVGWLSTWRWCYTVSYDVIEKEILV